METYASWPVAIILILALLVILLPVFALLDIVKKGVIGPQKIFWIIIILFIPILGSILYFLMKPGAHKTDY
jgi:hypothetical protein